MVRHRPPLPRHRHCAVKQFSNGCTCTAAVGQIGTAPMDESKHFIQRISVICTGNICRSPMAEALLREGLRKSDTQIDVTSAGLAVLAVGTGCTHPDLAQCVYRAETFQELQNARFAALSEENS